MRGKRANSIDDCVERGLIPARAGKTTSSPPTAARPSAHPRACGENAQVYNDILPTGGSSPRVRGKLSPHRYDAARVRLIPARAGKTLPGVPEYGEEPAHPRACGENGDKERTVPFGVGSSPRVRGKLREGDHAGLPARLIPARAGKTCTAASAAGFRRAHPRACGENSVSPISNAPARGSSPRVRGKPDSHGMGGVHGRLIPARAGKTVEAVRAYYNPRAHPRACGKTASTARTRACSPAHPRACGENSPGRASLVTTPGSSPRVRGKPTRSRPQGLPRGLIPARAGKTLKRLVTQSHAPAHPRACGENPRAHRTRPGGHGSSPRVRGKLQTSFSLIIGVRLIPARAGKTRESKAVPAGYWAHPRACGENTDCAYYPHGETGSSPRVRGKRGRCRRRPLHRGLIPARAGKTRAGASTIRRRRAHPRACGENAGNSYEEMSMMGSSPRVRGKQPQRRPTPSPPRLIPARAGKTNTTAFPLEWDRAHPRACGENRTAGKSLSNRAGSSPRVRGKPAPHSHFIRDSRLIPARAGKT